MDMVMVTDQYREFITLLQELVNEGKVPTSRIDDAVTRILRVKFAQGLMKKDAALMADPALQTGLRLRRPPRRRPRGGAPVPGASQKRRQVLPLSRKAKRIHVTGRGADDLGMQCGGWTVDWQGKRGEVTTGGTTILKALREAAGKETPITFSNNAPAKPRARMSPSW